MRGYYLQVDLLKALAIASVVLLHALPRPLLRACWADFHIGQAVPVFCVLMGFLAAAPAEGAKPSSLRFLYSREYFARRSLRLLLPFAIAWLASLALGLAPRLLGKRLPLYFGPLTAIGYTPLPGPGNYFVSVVLQSIVVLPLLSRCFLRCPRTIFAGCIALDVAFECASPWIGVFDSTPELYSACLLRYLAPIGIGMWLRQDYNPKSPHNLVILLALPLSFGYLLWYHISGEQVPFFREEWGTQNVLSCCYPAFLVVLGLRWLPGMEPASRWRWLGALGRASYHIFLFQMLWFAVPSQVIAHALTRVGGNTCHVAAMVAAVAVDMVACTGVGLIWFLWERRLLTTAGRRRREGA